MQGTRSLEERNKLEKSIVKRYIELTDETKFTPEQRKNIQVENKKRNKTSNSIMDISIRKARAGDKEALNNPSFIMHTNILKNDNIDILNPPKLYRVVGKSEVEALLNGEHVLSNCPDYNGDVYASALPNGWTSGAYRITFKPKEQFDLGLENEWYLPHTKMLNNNGEHCIIYGGYNLDDVETIQARGKGMDWSELIYPKADETTIKEPVKTSRAQISEPIQKHQVTTAVQTTEEIKTKPITEEKVSTAVKVANPYPIEVVFKDLHEFKGDNVEFAKKTYGALRKHFGYEGILDDLALYKDEGDTTIAAFSKQFCNFRLNTAINAKRSKTDIINTIRHEFEHFFQYERIFCSEDIGMSRFYKKLHEDNIRNMRNYLYKNRFPDFELAMEYSSPSNIPPETEKAWAKVILKKGEIKTGTTEAEKAFADFKAATTAGTELKDYSDSLGDMVAPYTKPDFMPAYSSAYDSCGIGPTWEYYYDPLEVNAREAGETIERQFVEYQSKINEKKIDLKPDDGVADIAKAANEYITSLSRCYEIDKPPIEFIKYLFGQLLPHTLKSSENINPHASMVKAIQKMAQEISFSDKTYLKNQLRTFKQLVVEDKIRLESPEAKEGFLTYTDKYLNS